MFTKNEKFPYFFKYQSTSIVEKKEIKKLKEESLDLRDVFFALLCFKIWKRPLNQYVF
jgi:hypothetical protein